MPAEVATLELAIRREEVLHYLGYPGRRPPQGRMSALLESVLDEARGLALARGLHVLVEPAEAESVGLEPVGSAGLVLGLVTIGPGIEDRTTDLMRSGDPTRALLLDAAGSAAVEEAADRLGGRIAGLGDDQKNPLPNAVDTAVPISCRISPGYGSWPLTAQRLLFDRLPHERIGVRLLPSMLMLPRKSISFAMWLGADARPLHGLSGCRCCQLDRCRFRRDPDR